MKNKKISSIRCVKTKNGYKYIDLESIKIKNYIFISITDENGKVSIGTLDQYKELANEILDANSEPIYWNCKIIAVRDSLNSAIEKAYCCTMADNK